MYRIYEEIAGELSPVSDNEKIYKVKQEMLTGITYAYIKVLNTNIILTEQDYIKDFEISELRFVPDKGIFGQCVAKKLEININNENLELNLQDKELEVYIRVNIENSWYYIKYGTFIVQKPETEITTDNTNFIALDYMIKFNQPYIDTITYPCTLRELANNICLQLGLTLAEESFRNENFIVVNNQFVEGESYRNVLQGIAMSAFSWARIDENNILHFDLNKKEYTDETIDYDGYFNLNKQDLEYGPINRIIIRESELEGENVTIEDTESIEEYGVTELVISDNPFAYTQQKRQQLIEEGRLLFGFSYMPINEISLIGYGYLDSTSKIKLKDIQNEYYETYLFNHIITYNGTILDKIETPALTKTETLYQYQPEISEAVRKTEIIVDKQNQTIESVVSNVSVQDQKISQITQTVDEINQKISDIADITVTAEDTDAKVELERINASEPVLLKVHPVVTNISYLYPRINLYPMSNLYMPVRTIRFLNTKVFIQTTDTKYTDYKKYFSYDDQQDEYTLLIAGTDYTIGDTISGTIYENKYIDYELPDDLLYYDSENYDEFYLDYDNQTCQISKKCEYNADGTVSLLSIPTTETYEYPLIELEAGDYEVSIVGYASGYIKATLMAENIYTTQFYTKVETDSKINQKADEITLGVTQTLSNYSTTNQMNSAINLKAGEITSTVSQTYETKDNAQTNYSQITQTTTGLQTQVSQKVGNNEVISKINQSSEAITIDANKISLARKNNTNDIR